MIAAPKPNRDVWQPSMVAGARIAVGRAALYTHRQLCRQLDPTSMFAYTCALAIGMSMPSHDRRANAIANAIVLAGSFLAGETLYERPAEVVEYEIGAGMNDLVH